MDRQVKDKLLQLRLIGLVGISEPNPMCGFCHGPIESKAGYLFADGLSSKWACGTCAPLVKEAIDRLIEGR